MRSPLTRLAGLTVLASAAIVATGCASMAVSSYAERGADIRRYQTYNWGPPDTFSTGDPRLDNNRFFEERVRAQVEKRLADKGLEKTAEAPDLLVHYHASVTQEIDVRDVDEEYAHCETGGCGPYVYDAGTLLVDLVDRRSNTLVWRGWAEGSVDGVVDNQEWLEERIDEAVARIIERLPRGL